MKILNVESAWVNENKVRLDASFHLSDGLITLKKIKDSNYELTSLKDETDGIFKGNIFRRTYVNNPEYGFPFLTASDMMKTNIQSGKYISKKFTSQASQLVLKKDWILISRSGTLGNTVYTNENFEGVIGTDDLIRVIPRENKVKPGFLYSFLSSKYGYGLLTQSGYGGVVQHIEPEHIENIPIPILNRSLQVKSHDLILKSAQLRHEAVHLLEIAKNLILNTLPPVRYNQSNFGIINFKNLKTNYQQRFDSPTFINYGVREINAYESAGVDFLPISEYKIKVSRPGIFKRNYVSSNFGIPYIKGSELNLINPFNQCVYLSKTRTPFLQELKLRSNQILFTCAGTVGDIKLITQEFEEKNAIGSQDIIRVESTDDLITPQFLFTYLSLDFVKSYIQSLKYGSVIERVEPFHVDMIPIINPSSELSQEVTEIIKQYSSNLYAAYKNEQEAIQLVEQEIESWQ